MCPVPIRLVRVKTGIKYVTFLDRDAVKTLRDYIDWRISAHGKFDPTGPLYVNKHGRGVSVSWISTEFQKLAVRAGVQRKISGHQYKIRAHELRDLLKTTLMSCGCAQHVADFTLGHKPNSYEKHHLYPEALRTEYAKASSKNFVS